MRDKLLIIYGISILLGIATGLIGSLFQLAISGLNDVLVIFFNFFQSMGWPVPLMSALTSMIMVVMAWILVKYYAPEASGSGVQEIEGTLLHERPIFWKRLIPVKFFAGVLAISAKMVIGREGPTIQMGGNLGEMFGDLMHIPRHRRDTLIAAGAAAGLATAFNAPLAGVLFVLEEMRNEFNFSFTNFKMVAICCVMAVITLHLMMGAHPAIPMNIFSPPDMGSLWLFFLFGILVGFVGLLFNKILMSTLNNLDLLHRWLRILYVPFVGALVGYLASVYPDAVGGGYSIIQNSLAMPLGFNVLCLLILIRFVTTMMCYSTSVPGGIFAPMLALGTLLGLAFSHMFQPLIHDLSVHSGMFAVAGMGALFAAAVRAPVTGIILVVEMTQNYLLILPLMVTCLTSTTIVQLAGNPPIYTQLLRRTLKLQKLKT